MLVLLFLIQFLLRIIVRHHPSPSPSLIAGSTFSPSQPTFSFTTLPMDIKKIHPDSSEWNASVEQEIFGNQAPYAAGSSTLPDGLYDTQDYPQPQPQLSPNDNDEAVPYFARPYTPESILSNAVALDANKVDDRTICYFVIFTERECWPPGKQCVDLAHELTLSLYLSVVNNSPN